jgi:hypothetical protein
VTVLYGDSQSGVLDVRGCGIPASRISQLLGASHGGGIGGILHLPAIGKGGAQIYRHRGHRQHDSHHQEHRQERGGAAIVEVERPS